ncbi:hypothetical protein PtA15_12A422 [Puccinia triticina]|uniref:Uncharacterized protein n=1 Tax=Puccinia triticina TaxID=208348 RepID=A0ABY7D1G0_9BASI|nr:uncharacterized protein PtA15_12A422 [Puccinia triticina]WAQ90433.1 hypothetical protein PtA15_12A422 [Puccinia triticina]
MAVRQLGLLKTTKESCSFPLSKLFQSRVMDSSRQTSRAHQRNQEHPQQSSYHPNVHQNASPDPDAHPDFEPDQSDEEEDSFDVTSLVPSTSNSIIQSGSVEGHTLERTGAYDTFLHTNQDHTGHLRQLNDLIPSPAAVKAHVERVSHSTINSSTFESHTAMSSMRMHIPREGVPITLHEETSEELRRSELSNNLYPTALDFQGSSDEDDCSTVHAPQEQAEKIGTDEKEIAMLRQQVQQLQRQVTSSPQLAVTERSTTGRLSPTSKDSRANDRESKVVHEREVSRMKIEIESLSKQLAMVSVKDQDLKHVKKNVRTLEEDAKTRMEVMAKLRAESHSLQHELKLTKKALKSAEDGQADALEQINRLQQRLDSISQERLSESQANLVKLTESRNGFNADLSELMSKLKASFQEAEQLRVELERSKSETCKACEAKEIRTTVLQEERNSLQTQLDDCRAQAADKEVQIDRLRKIRKELKSDIEGLNIALEAKQHENSYLKRDRHVREAGLTSSSLATSTRTRSNRTSIHLGSRTVTEGTINLEKSGHPILKPEHHNPRKSILENRTMLSSITNTSKRAVRPSSSESVSAVPSIPTLARKSLDRKSSSIALSRRGKYSQQKEEECLPVNAQQPLHAEEKKSENPKNTFRVCQT